jgi:large subunit ribosomal protein L22
MEKLLKERWIKLKKMLFIATQKYLLMSPKKLRPVADLAKKMKPKDALEQLPFVGKRGVEPIVKVLKNAMAMAKAKGFGEDDVKIKEIQIGDGPRLKRGIAVSRGQSHPIIKKMSHIRIVLETIKDETKIAKRAEIGKEAEVKETNEAKKEEKKVKAVKKGKDNGTKS